MNTFWYLLKVLPGKERLLNEQFNQQINLGKLTNITRFICPTENEYVTVKNKKILREKVIYTGYLYFETKNKLTEDELKELTTIPNIMGILGDKTPVLLRGDDVKRIIKDEALEEHTQKRKLEYSVGDKIIICDGPFISFNGVISKIEGQKVDVQVRIFGRYNLVTLNLNQIKKEF